MSLCSFFEASQNIMRDVGEKVPFCYLESRCPPLHCTEVQPHLDVHHWQLTTVENCLSCSLLPLGHPYKTQYEIQMSITLFSVVFVSHFLHCVCVCVYIYIYIYSIHINAIFLFPLCKCCLIADQPVANTKHHNFHTVSSIWDDLNIIGFLNV